MNGILGGQSMPPSILGGGYGTVRQMPMQMQAQPVPISASPFAMGGPADPRDAPGSGVSIWRELMRGLSEYGIGALAPNIAGKVFSAENRALLAPDYQKSGKGK